MNNTLSISRSFAGAGSLNVVRSLFIKIFWLLSFVLLFALIVLSVLRINSLIREIYTVQKYEKTSGSISERVRSVNLIVISRRISKIKSKQ